MSSDNQSMSSPINPEQAMALSAASVPAEHPAPVVEAALQEIEKMGVPTIAVPLEQLEELPQKQMEQILNPHGLEHDELRLIRDRLAAQSGAVMHLGKMLLAAGASAYRVKHSMSRLAQAVGIDELHSQVTFSEIIISAYSHGTFRTESAEQRMFGVNATLLDDLRQFVQQLRPKMMVEEINIALKRIAKRKAIYPAWAIWLAAGIACGCFCFLNHGGVTECILAGGAALFGQMLRRAMMHRRMNHFGVWMACALLSSLLYIGASIGFYQAGLISALHHQGIVSAVLFLVPGFPLVTGILDLVRMDFSAGISRLTYVTMLVISAGISVWLVASIFNWPVDPPKLFPTQGISLIALQFITSFVAAFGFAVLFQIKPHICTSAALIGATINVGRLQLVDMGLSLHAAAGLAALIIGLFAHLVSAASHYHISRVSLTVPAVVIMIPGVPLYGAITHLAQGNLQLAAFKLVAVFFIILAIGVGLALSRMITDPGWRIDRDTAKPRILEEDLSQKKPFRMR